MSPAQLRRMALEGIATGSLAASIAAGSLCASASAQHSVAREWNETMLDSIRRDRVRPPVQARNLFHLSVAMYDAWAAYDDAVRPYFFEEKITAKNVEAARRESISYAAYRLMRHRFAASPNVALIYPILDAELASLGYSAAVTTTVGNTPAAVGNRIAALVIARGLADNSREEVDHVSYPGTYVDVNPPLVVDLPFNPTVLNPNRYQPLSLSFFVDQNGNVIPGGFPPKVAPFWGFVTPFALTSDDMDPMRPGVPRSMPVPPMFNGAGDVTWRASHENVIHVSSTLTPDDGVMIDISPASMGNNPLGANSGTGRALNPVTGQPYAPNVVKRGDWTRCLAEFWADGPSSTTPPGHWNEIANHVVDHPAFVRRVGGSGPVLDALEWDLKMYVALNGAMHDAAIGAWGTKGHYDTMRPIGAIRHMAQRGQCSDPTQPRFNPDGLHLEPGLVELISFATTAPGQRHEELAGYEGEIAVRSWPGAPGNPATQYSGVTWMLAGMWVPYQRPTFVSPPFAGYVSGHSTYSRAGAEIMTQLTGTEYFPGGLGVFTCTQNQFLVFEDGPSQTFDFQWATYYDAADNSGQSRVFGGIHPDIDDFPGRALGAEVGAKAYTRALALFEPLAEPCNADIDGDGAVGAADMAALLSAWGTASAVADITDDGIVNAQDAAVLLSAWGPC